MTAVLASQTHPTTPAGLRLFERADEELARHVETHGFALLAGALSPDEVAAVNADAVRLCRGEFGALAYGDPLEGGRVQDALAADEELLDDDDVLRRHLCIHYPHKVSAAARAAMSAPRVVEALTRVVGPNVKAMQSMLFVKSEGKPGQAWHQDEFFIPTRDRSLTAVWVALDDATVENGCLWVLPGSHRRGVLYPGREQDDPAFDCTTEAYDFPYTDDQAVDAAQTYGQSSTSFCN